MDYQFVLYKKASAENKTAEYDGVFVFGLPDIQSVLGF
jgi:hypothetical protein